MSAIETLWVDTETRGRVNLRESGAYAYAESAEVLLVTYAFGDGPVQVIELGRGEVLPEELVRALTDPTIQKRAFNAEFDFLVLRHGQKLPLDSSQWACSSFQALYCGLPNSLANVTKVLRVTDKKADGKPLIRKFSIPSKDGTFTNPEAAPEEWAQFVAYATQDITAMRAADRLTSVRKPPARELRLWDINLRMNDRGILVDVDFVKAAIAADEAVRAELTQRAMTLTGLDNPNSALQLRRWVEENYGLTLNSLDKDAVADLLKANDDPVLREVLEIRQQLAKASTAKYPRILQYMCADNRVRGTMGFYRANRTGRFASQGPQIQNMPRMDLPDLDKARELVRAGDVQMLGLLWSSVIEVLSQLIRTSFIPSPGHRLLICDFSAIEARIMAWAAYVPWRLEVFRTHGRIYEASAEAMFGLAPGSVDKKSPYRLRGKIAELALGFGGGVGALQRDAARYGLQQHELQPIVQKWRAANPEVVRYWRLLENAARQAITTKGRMEVPLADGASRLEFEYANGGLFLKLPSGRSLAYPKAALVLDEAGREQIVYMDCISGGGWIKATTWGGKLAENVAQAIARDCLTEAMLRLDALGYQMLFTAHDEVVAEMPEGEGSIEQIQEVFAKPIDWAPGLLLRGDGYEAPYYRKEA